MAENSDWDEVPIQNMSISSENPVTTSVGRGKFFSKHQTENVGSKSESINFSRQNCDEQATTNPSSCDWDGQNTDDSNNRNRFRNSGFNSNSDGSGWAPRGGQRGFRNNQSRVDDRNSSNSYNERRDRGDSNNDNQFEDAKESFGNNWQDSTGRGFQDNRRGGRGGGFNNRSSGSYFNNDGEGRENDSSNKDFKESRGRGGRGDYNQRGANRNRDWGNSRYDSKNDENSENNGFERGPQDNRSRGFNNRGSFGDRSRDGGRRGGFNNRSNFSEENGDGNFGMSSENTNQQDFRNNRSRGGRGGYNNSGFNSDRNRPQVDGDERNSRRENDGKKEGEKPQPYIPPEMKDEDLFNERISCGVNFSKYSNIVVQVKGNNVSPKINSFEDANLREILYNNVKLANYITPTPIQQHAIPIIIEGRDIMGCAQTGSGKTAAFLLPILHNILSKGCEGASFKDVQEPNAVIIAPTRELVTQIYKEARKFSRDSMVRVVQLYGETSLRHQLGELERGAHVIVATPGRFKDVLRRGKISFCKLRYFVLDEADRLLNIGFKDEIHDFLSHNSMPEKRCTLMFSATFPDEVQQLALNILSNDYIFLCVGIVGGANDDVQQKIQKISKGEKQSELLKILKELGDKSVMVFSGTKRTADFLCSVMCQNDLKATSIHGDRYQHQREEALGQFKSRTYLILSATDVASRGLDINGVDYVINYDLPKQIEDYVHRIGRTGRVGNIGHSISFFDNEYDLPLVQPLIKTLSDAQQEIPDWLMQLGGQTGLAHSSSGFKRGTNFGGYDIRQNQKMEQQMHSESQLNDCDEVWD